jgi:hypothetical protein
LKAEDLSYYNFRSFSRPGAVAISQLIERINVQSQRPSAF